MAPFSQDLEPPQNPGRFIDGFAALAGGAVEVSLIANSGKIWLMVEPVDMRRVWQHKRHGNRAKFLQ